MDRDLQGRAGQLHKPGTIAVGPPHHAVRERNVDKVISILRESNGRGGDSSKVRHQIFGPGVIDEELTSAIVTGHKEHFSIL